MYGKEYNCLGKQGGCAGSSIEGIKVARPEMLCKTKCGNTGGNGK